MVKRMENVMSIKVWRRLKPDAREYTKEKIPEWQTEQTTHFQIGRVKKLGLNRRSPSSPKESIRATKSGRKSKTWPGFWSLTKIKDHEPMTKAVASRYTNKNAVMINLYKRLVRKWLFHQCSQAWGSARLQSQKRKSQKGKAEIRFRCRMCSGRRCWRF